MAAVAGSEASVRRIWRSYGLKPHLLKTFKVSRIPILPRSWKTSLACI